jgi:hypothetical protein
MSGDHPGDFSEKRMSRSLLTLVRHDAAPFWLVIVA